MFIRMPAVLKESARPVTRRATQRRIHGSIIRPEPEGAVLPGGKLRHQSLLRSNGIRYDNCGKMLVAT